MSLSIRLAEAYKRAYRNKTMTNWVVDAEMAFYKGDIQLCTEILTQIGC